MVSLRLYRIVQFTLLFLLAGGVLVRYFVRPPGGTSVGTVFSDIERTGRAHEVVLETVEAVRRLSTVRPDTPGEVVISRRGRVQQAVAAARELAAELQTVKSRWIPVAEATVLLNDCCNVGELALARSPTGLPAGASDGIDSIAEDLEPGPDPREMPAESVQIIETRARQLSGEWKRLELRVQQAIVSGMFARGSVLGLESGDLLLAATVLGCLLGIAMLSHACRRLSVSPTKVEHLEIELIGRTDRRAAMQRCHSRVRDLLQLADGFCRGQGI